MKRIVGALLLSLAGCVYHYPATVSTNSINSDNETPIRIKTGHSRAFYVLIFGPFGNDSLSAAVNDAIKGTVADTVENAFVDRSVHFYPFPYLSLFTYTQTEITGTLVKYKTVLQIPSIVKKIPIDSLPPLRKGDPITILKTDGKTIKGEFLGFEKDHQIVWIKPDGGFWSKTAHLSEIIEVRYFENGEEKVFKSE